MPSDCLYCGSPVQELAVFDQATKSHFCCADCVRQCRTFLKTEPRATIPMPGKPPRPVIALDPFTPHRRIVLMSADKSLLKVVGEARRSEGGKWIASMHGGHTFIGCDSEFRAIRLIARSATHTR